MTDSEIAETLCLEFNRKISMINIIISQEKPKIAQAFLNLQDRGRMFVANEIVNLIASSEGRAKREALELFSKFMGYLNPNTVNIHNNNNVDNNVGDTKIIYEIVELKEEDIKKEEK